MKHFVARHQGQELEFYVSRLDARTLKVSYEGQDHVLDVTDLTSDQLSVIDGENSYRVDTCRQGDDWQVLVDGQEAFFTLKDEKALRREQASAGLGGGSGQITSPMPGKILDIKVSVGDEVSVGQGVIVVEAMKMQNELKSQIDGTVTEIVVSAGDSVEGGAILVVIE